MHNRRGSSEGAFAFVSTTGTASPAHHLPSNVSKDLRHRIRVWKRCSISRSPTRNLDRQLYVGCQLLQQEGKKYAEDQPC